MLDQALRLRLTRNTLNGYTVCFAARSADDVPRERPPYRTTRNDDFSVHTEDGSHPVPDAALKPPTKWAFRKAISNCF